MADGFSVDLEALAGAATGIGDLLTELANNPVEDLDCDAGAFGHHGLAGTTEDFCDRWQKGVQHLAEDGKAIAGSLTETVNAYLTADDDAVETLLSVTSDYADDPATP